VKRGGSLSFLVGTISNVLVMEIGWTDVGNGGYILVSCAHSNTSYFLEMIMMYAKSETLAKYTSGATCAEIGSTWIPINLLTFEKSFLI
jgi:hypothetical protein